MRPRDLFQELYNFKGKEYEIHKKDSPDRVQDNITLLCGLFENSCHEIRQEIISSVVREISFLFLRFSELMAITAVRRRDKQCIVQGLEALAIENCLADWRDSTIRLALLNHSALKIGADPEELIKSVATLALNTAHKNLFCSFLDRLPEDKQLAKMGVKEGATPDGEFTYVSLR
jgi:hypothetical protein